VGQEDRLRGGESRALRNSGCWGIEQRGRAVRFSEATRLEKGGKLISQFQHFLPVTIETQN
jgi:hypothetical protein